MWKWAEVAYPLSCFGLASTLSICSCVLRLLSEENNLKKINIPEPSAKTVANAIQSASLL